MAAVDPRSRPCWATSRSSLLSYAALKGQIAGGKIKPLGHGAKRLPDLPDVLTVAESGFPGFEAYSWIGIFAPSGYAGHAAQAHRGLPRGAAFAGGAPGITQAGFEVMATDARRGPTSKQEYERWAAFVRNTEAKKSKMTPCSRWTTW